MISVARPKEVFNELVKSAIDHQHLNVSAGSQDYISGLLESYITTERLVEGPLAITYLKAFEQGREAQVAALKQLADFSLFFSGFFADNLTRKILDSDYYVLIGRSSYRYLSTTQVGANRQILKVLYAELAIKFTAFTSILSEISERAHLTSSRDVLRVYDRWLRTKSRHAERVLRELGIEPMEVSTSPVH